MEEGGVAWGKGHELSSKEQNKKLLSKILKPLLFKW